jgi:hypothetical protein
LFLETIKYKIISPNPHILILHHQDSTTTQQYRFVSGPL